MAITKDDFNKIWASTSPLTPYTFSDANYKHGWDFVGATPPARQMWDSIQKQNDEKLKYIVDNFLHLSGGTITGNLDVSGTVTAGVGLPPVGSVTAFAGSTTPQGWLLCDGSAVSRTDYADLYAVIGDTYGAGDGSTTFNVPNLIDRFVQGNATAGTVKSAGLPNITGYAFADTNYGLTSMTNSTNTSGSLYAYDPQSRPYIAGGGASAYGGGLGLDASRSSSIYGNSTTVQPPALTMRYIIKY